MFRRQFKTSTAFNRSFTLSYVIPGKGNQVETETFLSPKCFRDAFPGFRFTNPNTKVTISASCLPKHVDPTVMYTASHPFLTAQLEDYSHNQISDKVFEDKACKVLERHLNKSFAIRRRIPDNPTRPDGWRILAGEKDVAEWEGVWVGHDGHIYFLEAKHFMDADKLYGIRRKLIRSLDFLGIDRSKATIYVAGNHWLGDDTMDMARTLYEFGILTCNGLDLDV